MKRKREVGKKKDKELKFSSDKNLRGKEKNIKIDNSQSSRKVRRITKLKKDSYIKW